MNPFSEPARHQRREWNTFMCLLLLGARVQVPSEPTPYQTQTTSPRSARQLASRVVRSAERVCSKRRSKPCMTDFSGSVLNAPSLWSPLQSATLTLIASAVNRSQATGQRTGTRRNGITASSGAFPQEVTQTVIKKWSQRFSVNDGPFFFHRFIVATASERIWLEGNRQNGGKWCRKNRILLVFS